MVRVGSPARFRSGLERVGFTGWSADAPEAVRAWLRAEASVERLLELGLGTVAPLDPARVRACVAALASDGAARAPSAARVEEAMLLLRAVGRAQALVDRVAERVEIAYAPPFGPQPPPDLDRCPHLEELP